MKRGFTLVELSIVLVIIGLLIGGILVGQSLINKAKLNSIVKEQSSLFTLFALYKSKFKYLPGDTPDTIMPQIGGLVSGQLGNGYIDDYSHTRNVFYQLALSGVMKPEDWGVTLTGLSTLGNEIGVNLPGSNYIKNAGWLFSTLPHGSYPGAIMLFDFAHYDAGSTTARTVLDSLDQNAVDIKIDDGYRGTGNLEGFWHGSLQSGVHTGYCEENPNSYGYSLTPGAGCYMFWHFTDSNQFLGR